MGRGKFDFNMVAARRAARLVAVQVLYEIEISEKPVDGVLEETKLRSQHLDIGINDEIDDRLALPPVETDMDFCGELVRGVNANRYSIDEVIKRAMGVNRLLSSWRLYCGLYSVRVLSSLVRDLI